MKNNLKITPQSTTIEKELPKVKDCPNSNRLNSKRAAYSLS